MTTRIIKYIPKTTSARTEYREITPEDLLFLQGEMIRWLAVMSELDQDSSADAQWILNNWWHKRSKKLHKGHNGLNTPASLVGGIVMNIMYKEPVQRDLTNKQMEDLEIVSALLSSFLPEATVIRFQIGLYNE